MGAARAIRVRSSWSETEFSDRLAVENGWSKAYTQRVIGEYRRFVYLSQVAGHPVTPSDEVDQVWHLHLCYTRSYWSEMCGEILDRPLHHGSTLGGKEEQEKFVDWYGKTLESYREQFSEVPPRDIWPASRERFSARRFQRIDTSKNFVFKRSAPVAIGASLGCILLLAGCVEYFENSHGNLDAREILPTVFIVFILVVTVISIFRGGGGKGGGGSRWGHWFGCSGGGDSDSGGCSSGCGGGGCGS